jgi:hypothetical protein
MCAIFAPARGGDGSNAAGDSGGDGGEGGQHEDEMEDIDVHSPFLFVYCDIC